MDRYVLEADSAVLDSNLTTDRFVAAAGHVDEQATAHLNQPHLLRRSEGAHRWCRPSRVTNVNAT